MHRPQLCKIVMLNDTWVSLFYRGNLKEYFIYIYKDFVLKTNFKAMQSFENGRDADQVLALEVVLKRWRGGSGHEKLKLSD